MVENQKVFVINFRILCEWRPYKCHICINYIYAYIWFDYIELSKYVWRCDRSYSPETELVMSGRHTNIQAGANSIGECDMEKSVIH